MVRNIIIFTGVILMIAIVGCSKKMTDEDIKAKITGTWEGEYNAGEGVILENGKKGFLGLGKKIATGEQIITFTDTFTYSITRNGQSYVTHKTYYIKNGDLYLEHEDNYYSVRKITSHKLILEDVEGTRFTYKK